MLLARFTFFAQFPLLFVLFTLLAPFCPLPFSGRVTLFGTFTFLTRLLFLAGFAFFVLVTFLGFLLRLFCLLYTSDAADE